jgi:hypothetical protein
MVKIFFKFRTEMMGSILVLSKFPLQVSVMNDGTPRSLSQLSRLFGLYWSFQKSIEDSNKFINEKSRSLCMTERTASSLHLFFLLKTFHLE